MMRCGSRCDGAPSTVTVLLLRSVHFTRLAWFEGTLFEGVDAQPRATAAIARAWTRPTAPIMVGPSAFVAPDRAGAALVESAGSVGEANCELSILRRGRRQWPALVQRLPLAPGDALRMVYSHERENELYAMCEEWAEQRRGRERAMPDERAVRKRARRDRLDSRDPVSGQFVRQGVQRARRDAGGKFCRTP